MEEFNEPEPQASSEMPLLGFALGYATCYVLGYALSFEAWEYATCWPASGLYLAALATSRRRRWPALTAAAFCGNVLGVLLLAFDFQPLRAMAFWAGDTLEALIVVEILRRRCGAPFRLWNQRAALTVAWASIAATTLSATINATSVWSTGAHSDFFTVWRVWWIADLVGCLVAGPCALAWLDPYLRITWSRGRVVEAGCMVAGLAASTSAVFATNDIYLLDFGFVATPFLLWAALRFGVRGAMSAVALFAVLVIAFTVSDRGPFANPLASMPDAALMMQGYLCVVSITTQVLAVVVMERTRLEIWRQSETRFRELADTVPVMIWLDDESARHQWVNQRWLEFSGVSRESQRCAGWSDVLHPDDAASWESQYAGARSGRCPLRIEMRLRTADGQYAWCLVVGVPRTDDAQRPAGFVGSALEITQWKYAELALREAKETSEAASRAKTTFLAQMSHEVRTPLASIQNATELLQAAPSGVRTAELLSAVRESASTLRVIVDDLLDVSRIEAGQLWLTERPIPLRDLLAQTLDPLAALARSKGLRFQVTVAPDVPLTVIGDATRLGQVLSNLAGNAVKFTTQGEVQVTADVAADKLHHGDARPPRLRLTVRDTGIGIEPNRQRAIFDAFAQGNDGIARRFGGTGLGLSIASRLTRLMRGSLTVSSVPGQGSEFCCEIPLRHGDVDDPSATIDIPQTEPVAARPLHVLLVEDDPFHQRLLALMLTNAGHEVEVVAECRLAMQAYSEREFDVAVLDIRLSDGSGLDVAREIRARESAARARRLPLIALSAHSRAQLSDRFRADDFDAFLSKPVSRDELLATLEAVASKHDAKDRPVGAFDLEPLIRRLGGDATHCPELLREFLASTDDAAMVLSGPVADRDWTERTGRVHSMAGAAAFLGASRAERALRNVLAADPLRDPQSSAEALEVARDEVSALRQSVQETIDRMPPEASRKGAESHH